MLTIDEKRFFINTAKLSSGRSSCNIKSGAVLTRGTRLLSTGYGRKLLKDFEISAIYDAIFQARDNDLTEGTLFSTYFPDKDDLKLIIATGISEIYFFGAVNPETTILINNLTKEGIPLRLIQLK